MKSRLWNDQNGFTLPLSLVGFVVGFLMATPLLIGISTTMISVRNSQDSTLQLYAVDAAYEDAVWELKYGTLAAALPDPCDSVSYPLPEPVNGTQPQITVTRTSDCGEDEALANF